MHVTDSFAREGLRDLALAFLTLEISPRIATSWPALETSFRTGQCCEMDALPLTALDINRVLRVLSRLVRSVLNSEGSGMGHLLLSCEERYSAI